MIKYSLLVLLHSTVNAASSRDNIRKETNLTNLKALIYFSDISWTRLQAMLSSIEMEMPTATGVFEPERTQPYMPPKIEEKLVENSKVLIMFSLKAFSVGYAPIPRKRT